MGIGDSMGKAAENAMEDLAGTSSPADDAHAPEPGASDDDIQVHSSISEGSNARDNNEAPLASEGGQSARTSQREESGGTAGVTGTSGEPAASEEPGGSGESGGSARPGRGDNDVTGATDPPRDVPGPAGLPDPDPDGLRADPSEGDQDPSTGLGRG